jgi:hypothetical protein
MRRSGVAVTLLLVALSVLTGTAHAAPDDPWVAYVVNSVVTKDGQQSAVVLRVNPGTGALEEVSRNSGPQGSLFRHPYDVAVAPGGGSLYVVDMGEFAEGNIPQADGRIIRVDPASGAQSVVSAGGELVDPAGIAVAPDGTLFVVENVGVGPARDPAVLRIDPATGAQTVLTRGGNLCYPFGIALESNGVLVVTDFGDLLPQIDCPQNFGGVYRVNPGTGAQSVLSVNQVPSPGNMLRGVFGAAVEPGGGILVVNQTGAQAAVASINPGNGEQTALTPNSSAGDAFELPQRVAVLPDGNLLVADYALNDMEGGLVHVERTTGTARILRQGTLFNNPLGVAVVVNRAPAATINLSPRKVAGDEWVTYDATGSSDPEGLPLRYAWDLNGDGSFESSSGTDPRARSRFGSSTTLTPRVRVLDPHGGEAVAASAAPLVVDAIRPVISGFRASAHRIATSAGAEAGRAAVVRFRFRLSEQARVRISIQRAVAGRRKGRRCVAPGSARRSAKRCTRWRTVTTLRGGLAAPGPNSIRFGGKVHGTALKPGRYRGLATATDSVGNVSRPRSAGFRTRR